MPTVIYAEDDPEHRVMMRVALRNTNLTLIEAVDGQQALQKILSQMPDLILLDLFMPKLDGFSIMEAVKANPRTRHIPIVVLSAWPTGDNRKRTQEAGAIAFVAKPYDPAQLVKLLQKTLSVRSNSIPFEPETDAAPFGL